MAEIKTKPTAQSVKEFINNVESEVKRQDAFEIVKMMSEITGEKPVMWGPSIIGFGKYHYKYDSGHEGDMCVAGFSPRKESLVIYLMPGFSQENTLLNKLGKYRSTKGCLYIKKLADVDKSILKTLIIESVEDVKKNYEVY